MVKELIIMNGLILLYILQRIGENLQSLREKIFQVAWFATLLIESNYHHSFQGPLISFLIYLILGGCMLARIYIKVSGVSVHGLYRYVCHPNYLIVICELLLIPFLFKAYVTMTIFSLVNFYNLSRGDYVR